MAIESRLTPAVLAAVSALAAPVEGASVEAESAQQVYSKESLPVFSGPENLFTGDVKVEMAFPGDHTPYSGAFVTFQPGARTAWHSHPAGQHMVVTKGTAITATRTGQVVAFHEGDAVWCPQDIDHWHGATPDSAMTHFVVTGSKDGDAVTWKDKVTDAQYQAALNAITALKPELRQLTERHQLLATLVAVAAADDMPALARAVNEALDHGVSISESKEALLQLYPYAGFPKALNALGVLFKVTEERRAAGKKDIPGAEPLPLPAGDAALSQGQKVQTELVGHAVAGPLFDFAPAANTFLQKHLFGDVFARGVLTWQDREVLTLSMLAVLSGTDPQLNSHVGIAMNTGLTRHQITDLAALLEYRISRSNGQRLAAALNQHK